MDPLELLRLEAETIWGWTDGGLGCDTINATAISFDGRSLLIPGATQLTPEGAITASVSRTWILKPTPPNEAPAGLQLVTEAATLQPPNGWTDEQWAKLMSGGHGPWAAIADHGRVASLAHCARLSWQAAEMAFYSADEDNVASHRVAAKCRATPLGRLIQIALSAFRGVTTSATMPGHLSWPTEDTLMERHRLRQLIRELLDTSESVG